MKMKKVIVLMSTYNGEKYLRIQIDSILSQENVDVELYVRDDGSTDLTKSILQQYASRGKLKWYDGPNLKPAQSFFDLIFTSSEADYYAFSDQDDFWEKDKLIRAVSCLENLDCSKPLLYCSSAKLVDENLKDLGRRYCIFGVSEFSQSIISSNAIGCTMCFNNVLLNMVRKHRPVSKILHDGWVHKLCLAVGGIVYYDNNSYIQYRQHNNNVIGAKSTFMKKWKNRWLHLKKISNIRSSVVREILKNYSKIMPAKNIKLANAVAQYDSSFVCRLRLVFGRQISFPIKKIDIMFRIAVLLGSF